MGRQQGLASDLGSHWAIAQDGVGEDRAHRATRGARETPDGDAPETDTHIMRVTRQAAAAVTGRLVRELKSGQDDRRDQFNKGLAVAKPLQVGRFRRQIDGDGPVFEALASGCPKMEDSTISRGSRGIGAPPLNSVECGEVEAGPAAHHHPAGDAPRRGDEITRIHRVAASPATARHGSSRPFRAPPHHLGCGADRRGMCRCRAMCRWPTMACSSWMRWPEFRRHILEVLRQPIEDGVVTTAHVLAGIMAHTPRNCLKRCVCSRLRAAQKPEKRFTCTPANP